MKIYIAGPITGIFNYREKFMAAEEELIKRGHIVLNPSFLPDGLKNYMPICKAMIDQADALYMLKNYQASTGAMEEYRYARKHRKKIFFEEHDSTASSTCSFYAPQIEFEKSMAGITKVVDEWSKRNKRIQATGGV
ncbi:DUF4406 domain-containing protein [Anaerocolumna aminovalerica]|uniref:DUF4406 domain-containing protein n=1 Tax=Anaerocolumna aminovalerica TaxID=1527 RepID=UPI001C0EFE58|nr:DUF4406 domain-containing protein [Anaerocolumna aminovalerica]MBU5331428.1 DUF4406 domain-containing protein [Anaerocolumna aminovalerica]